MPRPPLKLTGRKFGRLTVLSYLDQSKLGGAWLCLCDCGNEKVISGTRLNMGVVNSCSCIRTEKIGNLRKTHGMSKSKLYVCWEEIRKRCRNPKVDAYKDYGGRGIDVCDRWYDSFQSFYDDMHETYQDGLTIERIDVNKGYCICNCKWDTMYNQGLNKRNTFYVTFNGQTKPLKIFSKEVGIAYIILYYRIKIQKWTVERALTEPKKILVKSGKYARIKID